jgi:hypothetical protein
VIGTDPRVLLPVATQPSTAVRAGKSQTYSFTVTNYQGTPVQDAVIKALVAGNLTAKTIATGTASLTVVPGSSNPTGTDAWETVFTVTNETLTTTIQVGTLVGYGVFTLSGIQMPGSATVGQKATISATVTNNGPVTDTAVVVLRVDSDDYAMMTVSVPGVDPSSGAAGTATVSFTYVPFDTSAHTLTLAIGTSTVEGSLTAGGAGGADMILTIGLGIVFLVVGIIVGFFIGKMGKKPQSEESEETVPQEINQEQTPPTPPPQ